MNDPITLAPTTETGPLGVMHLKRLWSSAICARQGKTYRRDGEEDLDRMVLNALGLGLHQTTQHLYLTTPTFAEFEAWIVETIGQPDQRCIDRLNAAITGQPYPEAVLEWLQAIEESEPVLSREELAFWKEHGYIVLKSAVSQEASRKAERLIWDRVQANPGVRESWYRAQTDHGIMVELIQHPVLEANRRARRIHRAFAQLWGTADLWVTADRCGFHPPQRPEHPFPGPDLHWDLDLDMPLTFGTQGILYLTDTPPEQGALTLVPGFHRRLSEWLSTLEPGADPQRQDLHALGSVPIGGKAGDMVIWHHALPHGSRPNLGERPRIVQYINMRPSVSALQPAPDSSTRRTASR